MLVEMNNTRLKRKNLDDSWFQKWLFSHLFTTVRPKSKLNLNGLSLPSFPVDHSIPLKWLSSHHLGLAKIWAKQISSSPLSLFPPVSFCWPKDVLAQGFSFIRSRNMPCYGRFVMMPTASCFLSWKKGPQGEDSPFSPFSPFSYFIPKVG